MELNFKIENALAAITRARITEVDGVYRVRADAVQLGDLLDFEGDVIADTPDTDETQRTGWQFELSRVEGVEVETIGDETAIVVYTSGGTFGFPPDHEIELSLEREVAGNFYLCGTCDHRHPAGFAGDCRDDKFRFTDSELEDGLGAEGAARFSTDPEGRELD